MNIKPFPVATSCMALVVASMLLLNVAPLFSQSAGADAKAEAKAKSEADAKAEVEAGYIGVSVLRGVSLPVRRDDETKVTESTKRIPVETFLDEDYGTLNYITASGGISSISMPQGFAFHAVAVGGELEAARISKRFGTVWRLTDDGWAVVEEADDEPLSVGVYDLKIISAEDENVILMRTDARSGKAWYLTEESWTLVADVE